ncbi:MAG TPA: GNAT family N-acetyltransferase [Fibrobacteria bacterium]|nr:GNAT family N-acetyltransferase [Fibrobacteria bacterium]
MNGVETEAAIRLEPETDAHLEFLRELFDSTREREMELLDWSEGQKDAFLDLQFRAQRRHYGEHFADAEFQIAVLDGTPVGRLCTWRGKSEIRIVDIALLPEFRGGGIGTVLIQRILAESDLAGIPVRIHLEKTNPAERLYRDLGFETVEDHGAHWLMERNASR